MFAYLDAGTLSIIGAALAGGIAGIGMLFRMYGNKILGVVSKKHRRRAEVAEGELLGVEIDPETGLPIERDDDADIPSDADEADAPAAANDSDGR